MSRSPAAVATLFTLTALVAVSPSAAAQDTARSTSERIDQLEQQIKILNRRREIEADSAAAAAKARASTSIGPDGFGFRSADGNVRLKITGYLQADGRFYAGDTAKVLTNNLLIRRARPIIDGTVYKYFDFRIMPDFGQGTPTLYETWIEAKLSLGLAIRAGKFKPPVSLERLQSAADLRFVERGFPNNLAPNRDLGIQIGGELGGGVVIYAAGLFNGVADLGFGDGDTNDAKDLAGRLFVVPFAKQGKTAPIDLGFGIAGSTGNERGTLAVPNTSSERSPGQATAFRYRTGTTVATGVIADGRRSRVLPQAYLYRGAVGLLAEYASNTHTVRRDTALRTIPHHAWQVAGSIFLTGEKASYRSVTPKHTFDPSKGQWGAIELAARVQGTDVDQSAFPFFADPAASAQKTKAWGVGVNWHLGKNLRVMLDYERATFTGGAPNGLNRPVEQFISTRLQTAF
ncbi:MAG: porin [Gemmatimonadota bacterium]